MSRSIDSFLGMPVRRAAALTACSTLLFGAASAPAYGTGTTGESAGTGAESGTSSAVVLRTGLDVALLDKSLHVPLNVTVNEVRAPASADKTALTVLLDGVNNGKPVNVLRADVATARATVSKRETAGYAHLARARVHVPGLATLPLVEVEGVTSKAVCAVGAKPVATSNPLGSVTVLGKRVTLSSSGTTNVSVPGVGEVALHLGKTSTTSKTAAAAALDLRVSINPLKLNVADVTGRVTLAEATCATPTKQRGEHPATPPATPPASAPPTKAVPKPVTTPVTEPGPKTDPKPATAPRAEREQELAETGGSSTTPYLAGGAAVLLAAGGGALILARRRQAARRRG
ncbi:SCO1860 family LAETG-anchored protein [Streptomyces zagrosensis]|uniref:LPXTG-motif cell wall-anchored protein n=1 Tax=Streptomyces zagrosensis TaxID=1042984 RepID=A0A7W9Q6K1_9ACTN|nr:SCO1860 family LAETG-anchored protein [Streptomyces zagrosensis]MBB5933672.1 LPXTG-motif cell wall-anchored protein [Streptomyces zagrosensis]